MLVFLTTHCKINVRSHVFICRKFHFPSFSEVFTRICFKIFIICFLRTNKSVKKAFASHPKLHFPGFNHQI